MKLCPHCHSPIAEDMVPLSFGLLILRRDSNRIFYGEKSIGIPPARARLLGILIKDAPSGPLSREALHAALGTRAELKIIDVHICHLRQDLKVLGAPVSIRFEKRAGYLIEKESA